MSPAERERASEDARAVARQVVARLYSLADELDDLGADLRAEVERRRTEQDGPWPTT